MRGRTILFIVASLVLAAVFARLGLWQIGRLHQRREVNALLSERMSAPPIPVDSVHGTADKLRYRRAIVSGRADYEHEYVYASRTRNGSPGAYLLTPVIAANSDTAILVARGWVYAPDGATVDRARWRESDSLTLEGYLDEIPPAVMITVDTTPGRPGTVTRIDRQRLEQRIGRPLRAVYLLATGDTAGREVDAGGVSRTGSVPARFTLPELDEGPHESYAFQWFSFAAIAVIGAGIVIRSDRRDRGAE